MIKLFFGNANKLFEIDLGQEDVATWELPNGGQIHHLFPATNDSFFGLRVTVSNGDHYYHQYFSPESGFTKIIFHVSLVVAFPSHDFSYLVTFPNQNL